MINSYSQIYNLGHSAIAELLKGPVIVEEKIDGSQFSFMKNEAGELQCRSKGAQLNMIAPEAMFKNAIETVNEIAPLMEASVVYRGEYLKTPKHNALAYDRVPKKRIIIFDVCGKFGETFLSPEDKQRAAISLGLECVPELYRGMIDNVEHFRSLIDRESVLGGQKIEGVVIKPLNYDLFGRDKKVLMGKFVSEAFREVHQKSWDGEHKTKTSNDILAILKSQFGTTARWQKAVIHLKERGELEGAPQDIPKLMAETQSDIEKECRDEIMESLYKWVWPQLRRTVVHGLPEWWKEQLLHQQFETK